MKKYLIIETCPCSPHIETSIEIALKLKNKNNKVFFFWCGFDLLWTDWALPIKKKVLSFSYEVKIEKVMNYLASKGIEIIPKFSLSNIQYNYINHKVDLFNNYEKLKSFKYKNKTSVGLATYSSLATKFHTLNINNFKHLIKPTLKTGCIIFERSNKIIQDINPDVVVTFNGRFSTSRPIIDSAKLNKKKFLIHERGSSLETYEIFKDHLHNNDYIYREVNRYWNKEKNYKKKIKIAKKYFSLVENKKFIKRVGLDFEKPTISKILFNKNKKIITYLCSTDYEYFFVGVDLKKYFINNYWSDQINTLKSIIKIIKNDIDVVLYIKSHPNFSPRNDQEIRLKKLETSNVIYLSVDDTQDTYELIRNSDLIFSFGTSLEIYAAYLNKKVISFAKSFYTNFNFIIYPKNETHLKELIYKRNEKNLIIHKKLYLYKVAFYLMTFGLKFNYYKSISYTKGYLKNLRIDHYGIFSRVLNFIYRHIK
jgi:hypothetical protein